MHRASIALGIALQCVVHATLGAQPAVPRLKLTQELRVDVPSRGLNGLSNLIIGPEGRMIFVEPADFRIRFLNAAGKEISRFGKRGQEPGEFDTGAMISPVQASVALSTAGDTIVAWDQGTRRFTLLTPDGRMIRTVPQPEKLPGVRGGTPAEPGVDRALLTFESRALFADGSILGRATWGSVVMTPRPGGGENRRMRVTERGFAIANADGDIIRVIANIPPSHHMAEILDEYGLLSSATQVPFIEPVYEAVAQDGARVAIGVTTFASQDEGALSIVVIGNRGDTLVRRTILFTPVEITKRTADSVMDVRTRRRTTLPSTIPNRPSDVRNRLDSLLRASIPRAASIYRGLTIGIDNSIWIARPTEREGSRQYLVLDERGNPYGMVPVPGRSVTVTRASLDMVWAVEYDGLRARTIARYRVTR